MDTNETPKEVPSAEVEVRRDSSEQSAASPSSPEVIVRHETQMEIERHRLARMQTISLAVLTTGALLTLMYVAKPVLIVLLVSILIAFMLAPIVDAGERWFRLPRPVGALIAVALMMSVLYGAASVGYYRAEEFVTQLPQYSGKIRAEVLRFRQHARSLQKSTENVLPEDQEDKNTVKVKQTSNWTDTLTRGAMSVTEVILLSSFVPFLVYFMLSWQEHVRTSTVLLFKIKHRNTAYVTIGLMSQMIRSFIVGNFVVGVFVSICSTIVFGILGLPYFYFIGILSGFLTLVPYLGVLLALLPPIAAGLGQMNSEKFIVIIGAVLGLHLFALNVLYPKMIGKRLQLNPLVVTISLLFWGWLWGAMGLILAVPLTAAMKIAFDHIDSLRAYGAWLGE